MFQQDYIMKQIRMLIQVLEQVLFRKKNREPEEALQLINEALMDLPDRDISDFGDLSLKETLEVPVLNNSFNAELAFILADLLFEKAELMQEDDASGTLQQSLLLYRHGMKEPAAAFPLEAADKITKIEEHLIPDQIKEVEMLLKG